MENKITFSQIVKEELVTEVNYSKERLEALLSAYIRINGVIKFSNKVLNVVLKTETAKIAKFIYSSIKSIDEKVDIEL